MKKSSFNNLLGPPLVVCFLLFIFFIPPYLKGKLPIPADSLLGLYHPWRDRGYDGYSPYRFPTKNPIITDPILQTYPWRKLVVENIRNANLPLWNPYSFAGYPLLANVQSAPFQLANILFFIFPFKIAWSVQIILPAILTSFFMFLLLKDLKCSPIASIFGSLILSFSGFFIAWLEWGTVVTAAMWLPLILLSLRKIFFRLRALWFLILVFALSQTIFSGHLQTSLYVFFAATLYLLNLCFQYRRIRSLLLTSLAIVLAVTIAQVQLIPTLEFINLSARDIDQGFFPGRPDWFLPPQNLVQLVAPDFFGNPATYNYWGVWNWAEFVSFIGIIPLGLVFFNFFKKNTKFLFFLALAVISIILALENPISKIPYRLNFPLIASAQPSRIIFLFTFSLSTLAAFGLDNFLNEKTRRRLFYPSIVLLFVLIMLICYILLFKDKLPNLPNINSAQIALRNLIFPFIFALLFLIISIFKFLKLPKSFLILCIISATLLEIFRFGYKFTPFSKLSWIFPETQTTNFLKNRQKPFRIMATDRRILNGNTPSAYQIETVHGYDPLYLKDYAQLVTAWESGSVNIPGSFNRIVTPQKYDSPITNFLNVRYIVTFDEIENENFIKVHQEGETKVFQNKNALPRAFFVEEVIKAGSRKDELAKMLDKDFDLAKMAVSSNFRYPKQQITSMVNFQEYQDQKILLKTDSDKEAPLVVSNVFYPGWQATIDGHQTPIRQINYMFQGLVIPQGQHEIEFKFQPKSFYNGLYISTTGLVLTILLSLYLWRRKYQ